MTSTHSEQALAAAYVLGALDADERRAFEAHLAQCAVCDEEVRSLQRVTETLARSVPQRTPRPELRSRVLSVATGSAVPLVREQRRAHWTTSSWLQLAAVLLLVAGVGGYAWQLQRRVSSLAARVQVAEQRASAAERGTLEARRAANEAQAALAVLAAPDLVRVDLAGRPAAPQATARALWSRQRGMVFTTAGLPPAPAGRVYQVWVVTAQAPVSAGLLAADPSGGITAFFRTPADIAAPTAVAVTLEPAGGVPAPTGEMYLVGTPRPAL
jgi:anti-sigma-K factor RskA